MDVYTQKLKISHLEKATLSNFHSFLTLQPLASGIPLQYIYLQEHEDQGQMA